MVGTWTVEVNLRGVGEAFVSQALADLYVCASARGDPRATGAFLVVRQWSVESADTRQHEQLYGASASPRSSASTPCWAACPTRAAPRANACSTWSMRGGRGLVSPRPAAGSAARGTGRRPSDRRSRPARRPWARHRHPAARSRDDGADAAHRGVANAARAGGETTLAPSIPVGEVFVAETVSPRTCAGTGGPRTGPVPCSRRPRTLRAGGRRRRDPLTSVVVERPERVLQMGDDSGVRPAVREPGCGRRPHDPLRHGRRVGA